MNNLNVVVVDDDKSIRLVLSTALTRAGFNVTSSGTTAGLWRLIEAEKIHVLITDVGLPDGDSLDILPKLQKLYPKLKIIVISARSTLITAVRAQKKGAYYYLPKPFDLDEIINLVSKILHSKNDDNNKIDNNVSQDQEKNIYESGPIIGKSKIMQETYKIIARLVPNNLSVLITGESGTGKNLVARAIHDLGANSNKSFIKMTMSDFSKTSDTSNNLKIEDEHNDKFTSKMLNLNAGTILIDGIDNGTLFEQAQLINLLENENIFGNSSFNYENTNPRIIVTSKIDLLNLVNKGLFRDDLYYKINIVPINLPPLRDRIEDISRLIDHFLDSFGFNNKKENLLRISESAIQLMKNYNWPGNIKELKNVIERLAVTSDEKLITKENVKTLLNNIPQNSNDIGVDLIDTVINDYLDKFFVDENIEMKNDLHETFVEKIEKPLITGVLKQTRGNQIKAAKVLGFNRNTLRKKINKLDIKVKKVRKNSL